MTNQFEQSFLFFKNYTYLSFKLPTIIKSYTFVKISGFQTVSLFDTLNLCNKYLK